VRGPRYPVRGYSAITEFRAMLMALASGASNRCWNGAYFVGWGVKSDANDTVVCFRAHDNGITFTFSEDEWQTVCELVRRAWEMPDVRMAWDRLVLEYGEL